MLEPVASVNRERVRPFYSGRITIVMVVMLLLIAAIMLYTTSRQRHTDFIESQHNLMSSSARDALQMLNVYFEQTNRLVKLFVASEMENIRQLSDDPGDEQVTDELSLSLDTFIPDNFTFTLTDEDGELLLDDFEGEVGEVCRADIQVFSQDKHPQTLVIHPNPLQYHFDIMTRVTFLETRSSKTGSGVFFVSFKPDLLSRHLASSEVHGHRLMLLHRDDAGLIEVTAKGARDVLGEHIRLSPEQLESIEIRFDVPGTLWELVYLPNQVLYDEVKAKYNRQALFEFLVAFAFCCLMLVLIRKEEIKRRKAEAALQQSHDQLEDAVQQRTSELRQSERRYALAAKGVNDGIWEWQADSSRLYLSARWQKIAGIEGAPDEAELKDWLVLIHEEDRTLFASAFENARKGIEDDIECIFRFDKGGYRSRWCLCRAAVQTDEAGNVVRMAGSISDITDQKRAEQQLEYGALHDVLTGLPNRGLFIDRLRQSIHAFQRNHENRYAVLILDLDRFKSINDDLGQHAGDELLIAVAERLATGIRPGDTLARQGDDKFVILMSNFSDIDDVTNLAERALQLIVEPCTIENQEIYVNANIGIVLGTTQYNKADDVLRDAETAMHRSRETGAGAYFIFE